MFQKAEMEKFASAALVNQLRKLAEAVEKGEVDVHEVSIEYLDFKYVQPFPQFPERIKITLIASRKE